MSENLIMAAHEQPPVQNALGETAPKSAETQKKILVIDDDPVTVKVLTAALTSKGYAVYSARDGAEAIGVVRDDAPDMLLVDVNLEPQEAFGGAAIFDGFQVTRWLRHMTAKDIPAIMISASDKSDYRKYAAKIGAETFLAKPISNAVLLQSIQSRLGDAPAASGNAARL
jgi:chemosensory pili system protein ChpA (sensor histidine kinase/response regulator)